MKFNGLVVYIKFNGEQEIWDDMIDLNNINYKVIPTEILFLQSEINNKFNYYIPLTFRYLYALREFDFVGVFINEEDSLPILNFINNYISSNNIETLKINTCYGEVGYLPNETDFFRIVHHMFGKAVYGAIKY